ncbi:MAG: acetyl-coenzyme A synthetase N-terminal domain-containing protein, partial [Pseudomonadota bacterium]
MTDTAVYPVPSDFAAQANLSPEKYAEMYAASIADPEGFWREQGQRLDWSKPYSVVKDVSVIVNAPSAMTKSPFVRMRIWWRR